MTKTQKATTVAATSEENNHEEASMVSDIEDQDTDGEQSNSDGEKIEEEIAPFSTMEVMEWEDFIT